MLDQLKLFLQKFNLTQVAKIFVKLEFAASNQFFNSIYKNVNVDEGRK